jgi:hypothetical protein
MLPRDYAEYLALVVVGEDQLAAIGNVCPAPTSWVARTCRARASAGR